MPPTHHADIAARLDLLVQQINASRPCRHQSPGRPSQGIRAGYVRTEIYLEPDVRDALDRASTQSGTSCRRSRPLKS